MEDEEEHRSLSSPNEAIFFVLPYLPVCELLGMAQVCKSLRDAINGDDDILPWMKVVVGPPLNRCLSDETLIKITSKAKGNLHVLALLNCVKITDDGLLRVVAQNPHITHLLVPNCTSLSPGGLVEAVKLLSRNRHTLKALQINGVRDIGRQELETLGSLMNLGQHEMRNKILYHEQKKVRYMETDRSIDVEVCPKCNRVGMVFECTQVPCPKQKQQEVIECRGCELCIVRCVECGVCIPNDQEPEEVSCPDTLCLECWLKLPKCDLCNKPSCSQHAGILESTGFACATCNTKFN